MDTEKLTAERGAIYGHPRDDFGRVAHMVQAIQCCPDERVRHTLYMILVKVARLCNTPDHEDSWRDIAGYARTGLMLFDLEK